MTNLWLDNSRPFGRFANKTVSIMELIVFTESEVTYGIIFINWFTGYFFSG